LLVAPDFTNLGIYYESKTIAPDFTDLGIYNELKIPPKVAPDFTYLAFIVD